MQLLSARSRDVDRAGRITAREFSALQTAATHLGTTVALALIAWLLAGIAPLLSASLIGALALPAYLRLLRIGRA